MSSPRIETDFRKFIAEIYKYDADMATLIEVYQLEEEVISKSESKNDFLKLTKWMYQCRKKHKLIGKRYVECVLCWVLAAMKDDNLTETQERLLKIVALEYSKLNREIQKAIIEANRSKVIKIHI